jgi:hypothetical protein
LSNARAIVDDCSGLARRIHIKTSQIGFASRQELFSVVRDLECARLARRLRGVVKPIRPCFISRAPSEHCRAREVAEFGRIGLNLARAIGSTRARCTTPVDDAADKKRQKGRQKPKVVLDLFPVL